MKGINRFNGQMIDDIDHVKQSISDILTTPLGLRVQLRDYGSRLFEYVDRPMNHETIINIILESAKAIDRWEMRVILNRIIPTITSDGRLVIDVDFTYRPNGEKVKLRGVRV